MTSKLELENLPFGEPERRALAQKLKSDTREAQARSELISAMLYACDALMLFPNDDEYLALVDELCASTPQPLTLVPAATGSVHVATAAVRARIFHQQGKHEQALDLLGACVAVAPDLAYLEWGRQWLSASVMQSLGFEKVSALLLGSALRLSLEVPSKPDAADRRLPNVRAAAEIFATARGVFPGEVFVYSSEAMIRRRLGDPQVALQVALEGSKRFPSNWRLLAATAAAWCDAKNPDEALKLANQAIQLEPGRGAPLYDVAWSFFDLKKMREAIGALEAALDVEPGLQRAVVALHYMRFVAEGSEEDKQALIRMRERRWWDRQARSLANEVDAPVPYYNTLPGPGEATAAGAIAISGELRHVLQCCGRGANIGFDLHSTYLESPSVALGFDVAIRALGGAGATLRVLPENVQSPDPRVAKAPVPHSIWTYEETSAKSVLPAADPRAQAAIASIADQVFRMETWDAAAHKIASEAGAAWTPAFMSVLTDPPLPPEHGEFDGVYWTYRCQVATALVLSHMGEWAEGAPGRGAVYSMAYGPSDWLSDAALVAMAWRARANPALRPEVESVFQWLRTQIPAKGFTSWEAPLCHLWIGLGGHAPQLQAALDGWRKEYESTVHLKNRARKPERRFGGLTLQEYAEYCYERDKAIGNPQEQQAAMRRFGLNGLYVKEWQEALNANGTLQEVFAEMQRNMQLLKMGVSGKEIAAMDQIRDGKMDMHLRMAQQQEAQRKVAAGDAGEADPVVFPGQPVAKLSDYVGIMKRMQTGDMMGALGAYGLDMMSYATVASAWSAKFSADPSLNEKFSKMMSS